MHRRHYRRRSRNNAAGNTNNANVVGSGISPTPLKSA